MNGLEKIELLEKIGLSLQARMTFDEIDIYFRGHGVPTKSDYPHNSKRAYAKAMLAEVDSTLLFEIAGELAGQTHEHKIINLGARYPIK